MEKDIEKLLQNLKLYSDRILKNFADERIIQPGFKGRSQRMMVGGKPGFFDWSVPPRYSPNVGGNISPMYLFVQDDGQAYFRRLEKDKQGGRWEDAWHAKQDWKEMKRNPQIIDQMWGNSPTGIALKKMARQNFSYDQMKKGIKQYNTWRNISGDPAKGTTDYFTRGAFNLFNKALKYPSQWIEKTKTMEFPYEGPKAKRDYLQDYPGTKFQTLPSWFRKNER